MRLDNTDLVVSRIGFGCEQLGGTDWGYVNIAEAESAAKRALDLGVNFFDTADVYGLGLSEERLSKALGKERNKVVIATKFGVNWESSPNGGRAKTFYDAGPGRVSAAIESSLRRLKLESIPLYQIHWLDPQTPISLTMEALMRCKEAGKIRHIGCSNFTAQQIREADSICHLASLQCSYNLIDRLAEREVFPVCDQLHVGCLAYGPLAQGLLSGNYGLESRFAAGDRRRRLLHFQKPEVTRHIPAIHRLSEVGRRYGKSAGQVAIRWVLANPSVACAIVGVKTPKQIEEIVTASTWNLRSDDLNFLAATQEYLEPSRVRSLS